MLIDLDTIKKMDNEMQTLETKIISLIQSGHYKEAVNEQVVLNAKQRIWRNKQLLVIEELNTALQRKFL